MILMIMAMTPSPIPLKIIIGGLHILTTVNA